MICISDNFIICTISNPMKLNKIGIVSSDSVHGPRPYAIFWHVIATLPSTLKRICFPLLLWLGRSPHNTPYYFCKQPGWKPFIYKHPQFFLNGVSLQRKPFSLDSMALHDQNFGNLRCRESNEMAKIQSAARCTFLRPPL